MEINTELDTPKVELTSNEKLGKLILTIGNIPVVLVGGLLLIGGFLLFLVSMGNRTEGAWVDPAGFGALIGLLAILPGVVILGLWYLSRLGPRNPSWTIFSISTNLLIGLAAVIYLINSTLTTNGIVLLFSLLAPIPTITGSSALIGWWLRGMFNWKVKNSNLLLILVVIFLLIWNLASLGATLFVLF